MLSLTDRLKMERLKELTGITRSKAANGQAPARMKVSLTAAQEAMVEERAKRRNVSKSTIIRELVDAGLKATR